MWRDIKVRYKQTALGAAWAILQPLLTALVFTFLFSKMAGISSDGLPYPLFSVAGLWLWTFFTQGLNQSSSSLVASSNLITKVYFPRQAIPLASVLSGLVDLAVSSPVLIGMMIYYSVTPGWRALAAPGFLVLAVVTVIGIGLWLSALNVEYRDVRYVVPFMIQLWLFLTPVIYPASELYPKLSSMGLPIWVIGLNPMAGVVEGLRWSLLGASSEPIPIIIASTAVSLVLFLSGAIYFRNVERSFADLV
jgi:lipopolysaccharide transport system permease protein